MHGKITAIRHNGTGCFAGLPETFSVTRYHSLTVQPDSLPDTYRIDAVSEDGAVMAISHRYLPVYGVQFHPEACAGPEDTNMLFDKFIEMMGENNAKGQ